MIAGLTLCAFSGQPTAADYEADGHPYALQCKASGYQLTSRFPIIRKFGSGAATESVNEIEVLTLSPSCNARHELFGVGSWCWANGGFFATFADHKFEFWRQELFCDPEQDYELNCRCE